MDCIGVRELRLWAHVGVLEHERRDGQWFSLDFSVQLDLKAASVADDLSRSLDYGVAIQALQSLSQQVRCLTIEHFSEQMLDRLETLYGPIPVWLRLTKCAAPVPGFNGRVFVERSRHGGRSAL